MTRKLPLLVAALLLALPSASGQVHPVGEEYQVNLSTRGIQQGPASASLGSLRAIAAFESETPESPEVPGSWLLGRTLGLDGEHGATEIEIHTPATGGSYGAALAAAGDSSFAAAWTHSADPDFLEDDIYARLFDAGGSPLGPAFLLNSYTTGFQNQVQLAYLGSGQYVAAWRSNGSSGPDNSAAGVLGQRFDSTGSPVGPEFQVNTYVLNQQHRPVIAARPSGGFIVVWESFGSFGDDTSFWSIQAQLYDALGAPEGSQFQVNSLTTEYQLAPAVAVSTSGEFLVAWGSDVGDEPKPWDFSLRARWYSADGAPKPEFAVSSFPDGGSSPGGVALFEGRGTLVVWASATSSGSDDSQFSIQGRFFAPDGEPWGGQFQVNEFTSGYQLFPAVTALASGEALVTWDSNISPGPDFGPSVRGRFFKIGFFFDGFERGSTERWSSSQE